MKNAGDYGFTRIDELCTFKPAFGPTIRLLRGGNVENAENVLPRRDLRISTETQLLSLIGGVAAISIGVRRGRFWGPVFAAVGAELLTFGLSGHYFHEFLGLKRADRGESGRRILHQLGVQIRHAITIDRPVEDVYDYFRNFESLPRFMNHLQSVKVFDENRSHWTAKGPMGSSIEWDAEIITDEPNRLISWRSVNTPDVETAGSVRFVSISNGRTLLQISMQYLPPGGALGTFAAKLLGEEPEKQIEDDLRRFKELMESEAVLPEAERTESHAGDQSSVSRESISGGPEGFSQKREAAGSNEPT